MVRANSYSKKEKIIPADGIIEKIIFEIIPYVFDGEQFLAQLGAQTLVNEDPGTKEDRIFFADLNGDGRVDIHHQIVPKHNVFGTEFNTSYYSFGKGFLQSETRITDHRENAPQLILADMNNNARADWLYLKTDRDPVNYVGQFIQTITHFAQPDGSPGLPHVQKTYITNATNYAGEIAGFTIADITGNGISDLIATLYNEKVEERTPVSKTYRTYALFDTEKLATDAITSISNGLGAEQQIKYQSTSNSLHFAGAPEYPLGKMKIKAWTVSETYVPDGSRNKLDHVSYQFINPVIMLRGKGFLGFMKTIVSDSIKSISTSVNYEVITHKIDGNEFGYNLLPVSSISESFGERKALLSESITNYKLKFPISGSHLIHFPVATESITKTWDNDPEHSFIRTVKHIQELEQIDNYGNSLRSQVLIDKAMPIADELFQFKTIREASYESLIDKVNWIVGRPETISQTKISQGENADKLQTNFEYLPHATLVKKETIIPNANDTLTYHMIYEYGKYGNMTKVIHDPGKFTFNGKKYDQRVTAYEYEDGSDKLGRFLTATQSKVNNTTYRTDTEYSGYLGNVIKVTGADKLETVFVCDVMGRKTSSFAPNDVTSHYELEWQDGHPLAPDHQESVYFTRTYRRGAVNFVEQETQYQFYDRFGRVIRSVSFGLNNEPIFVDHHYNHKGRLMKISEPYFQSEENQLHTLFYYDDFGRAYRTDFPTGNTVLQQYQGRTTTTLDMGSGVVTTTMVDASGQTSMIKDPHGEIEYTYYSSGQLKTVDALGAITRKFYDDAGRVTKVVELNSGETNLIYNPFGELIYQQDSRGNVYEISYDNLGRITEKKLINTGESTAYNYIDALPNPSDKGMGFGQLRSIVADNGFSYHYEFDEFSRLIGKTEYHPDGNGQNVEFHASISYDQNIGRISSYSYPSGFEVGYDYANNGQLDHVYDKEELRSLWKAKKFNARGQILEYINGNGLKTSKDFSPEGYLLQIKTGDIQDLTYTFDPKTGNLLSRSDNIFNLNESFTYDAETKSRLMTWGEVSGQTYYSEYARNGNISFMTGVTNNEDPESPGKYNYAENAGPHALTSISSPTPDYLEFASFPEYIRYTPFNKVASIRRIERGVNYDLEIDYGPDNLRKITHAYTEINNVRRKTRTKHFVMDNYEVEIDGEGNERRLHYLHAADGLFAIMEDIGKQSTNYYIHKNFQGSIYCITGTDREIARKDGARQIYSFDPWGRRRNFVGLDL